MSEKKDIRVYSEHIRERQVINQLKKLDKSPRSIGNVISAFKQMIKLGFLKKPLTKDQFHPPHFDRLKQNIKTYSVRHNTNKQWSSYINDIQYAVLCSSEFRFPTATFSETLVTLLSEAFGSGASRAEVAAQLKADHLNLKYVPVHHWMAGTAVPRNSEEHREAVKFVDEAIGADGMLIKKYLQYYPYQAKPRRNKNPNVDEVYFPKLIEELKDYTQWKLNGTQPKKTPEQYKNLPTFDAIRLKPILKDNWSINANGLCKSSMGRHRFLTRLGRSYLQYSDEVKASELQFHHFLDINFIDFHVQLSKDKGILSSAIRDIRNIRMACKKNSFESYYYIPPDMPIEQWEKELEAIGAYIVSHEHTLKKLHEVLDGARHIRFIIDSANPDEKIDAISQFLYESQFVHTELEKKVMACSVSFFWEMCRSCPLRVSNAAQLRWLGELSDDEISLFEQTQPIGLYKHKKSGDYHIYVHKKHLKNRDVTGTASVHQNISYMNHIAENLISVNTEFLAKKEQSGFDYLFFRVVQTPTPFPEASFNHRFRNQTYTAVCYLFPEVDNTGINPHAMRHLAATMYLRDNPKDFSAVATMLMDSLETVIRVYAKVDNLKNSKTIHNWVTDKMFEAV